MKMENNFDVAIFDMDGTLLDSMRYWRFTTLEFLLSHRLPVRNEDLVRMLDTSSRKLLFEIAEREGVDIGSREAVVSELEKYMNRHYLHDTSLKDKDLPTFLQKLKDCGIRMCVATGSPREFARNGLKRQGILDYFEFVTDNYERGDGVSKDQPEYFVHLAARLGVAPERCVVFEDALYAMESAKAAGCRVLAIEDSTAHLQREAILQTADWCVANYAELIEWMDSAKFL